jgi:type IV pilus assembly protein PilY1
VTGVGCAPALLWKTGCPNLGNDTDCAANMSGIGQTWSAPVIMRPQGYTVSGNRRPVVIVGGGYDNCEDADVPTATCKSSAKGRAVYVFDAVDGARLRTFTTDRPVVADVFEVSDSNGDALWAYVADLGGNVYRISGATATAPIGNTLPGSWTMTKIASLGCDGGSTSCTVNRKFMFMPDIVEDNGTFYLMLGSGDREKPLTAWPNSNSVANKFFMIIDKPTQLDTTTGATWLTNACGTGNDFICTTSLLQIGRNDPTPAASAFASTKGWYLDLASTEQVVTSAITVFGNVTFSTHTPTVPVQGACTSNLGTPRVYNVNYLNAAPRPGQSRFSTITGTRVGLPPSPVAGTVRLNPSDPTTEYPFIIGANPGSPLEAELPPPPSTGTQPRSLTYWYVER